MSGAMKPNRKYQHMYAILRYEADSEMNAPIEYSASRSRRWSWIRTTPSRR